MIIGADELIYRIRKNGGAKNVDNLHLGRRIVDLITKKYNGSKEIPDMESFWDISSNAKNINEFGLCQSSEQYKIDAKILPQLYAEIDQW